MRRVVRDNDEFSVVKVCDYGDIVVSCTHEGINIPFPQMDVHITREG